MKQQGRLIFRTRRLIAGLALAGGLAVATPAAEAGTYDVYGCKDPVTGLPIGPAMPSGWAIQESPAELNYFAAGSCDKASGRLQLYPNNNGGSIPQGRKGDLSFIAPANTVVRAFDIYRSMQISGAPPFIVGTFNQSSILERCDGRFDTCPYGDPNSPFAATNHLVHNISGQGSPAFAFSLQCDGTCPKDPSAASLTVFSSKVTLEETEKPSFTSPPAGSLLEAGTVAGTRSLDFVAADVGSGVHKVTVTSSAKPDTPLASKVVDSGNGHCDTPKFAYVVPCPLSIDDLLNVDTLQFPDGAQTITITLEDAAGNTKAVTRNLTVRNAPDSTSDPSVSVGGTIKAGDELTCDPGTFTPAPERIDYAWLVAGVVNGSATSATYTVRAIDVGKPIVCRVTAVRGGGSTTVDSDPVGGPGQPGGSPTPNPSPSPGPSGTTTPSSASNTSSTSSTTTTSNTSNSSTTGTEINNPANANGSGGLVTSARFTAASKQTRRIKYGQTATLTGQLRDAEGRPIRGATVDVYSAIARKGQVQRQVGSVTTDADGSYRWVAPIGVSRNIRFAYRATLGATEYSDVADVALRVRGRLTFKAVRRHVRSFGTMHLRGRLFGSGLPSRGALIEIQYLDGTKWKPAAVRRTKRGKVRFDYRFKRTKKGTFTFRARLRNQTGVPLLGTVSKKVVVKVG